MFFPCIIHPLLSFFIIYSLIFPSIHYSLFQSFFLLFINPLLFSTHSSFICSLFTCTIYLFFLSFHHSPFLLSVILYFPPSFLISFTHSLVKQPIFSSHSSLICVALLLCIQSFPQSVYIWPSFIVSVLFIHSCIHSFLLFIHRSFFFLPVHSFILTILYLFFTSSYICPFIHHPFLFFSPF